MNRRNWIKTAAVLLPLTALIAWASPHLVLNFTASVPYRLMWQTDEVGRAGEYATFYRDQSHHSLFKQRTRLTKQVACVEGQQIEFRNGGFWCDGMFIGRPLERTESGKRLQRFRFEGAVPKGKAFMAGTHEKSFDSRYWGFVDISETRIAKPIL